MKSGYKSPFTIMVKQPSFSKEWRPALLPLHKLIMGALASIRPRLIFPCPKYRNFPYYRIHQDERWMKLYRKYDFLLCKCYQCYVNLFFFVPRLVEITYLIFRQSRMTKLLPEFKPIYGPHYSSLSSLFAVVSG